jgi:hypothetical protein
MNRFAASLSGGLLLMTTSLMAQASAPDRADAVVLKDAVHAAAAAGELTGLLSADFIAPAERVMLAAEPAPKQTSSKKC